MKHLLIDFENVRPKHLDSIIHHTEWQIWLFLGIHQQKQLPLPLVKSLLRFTDNHVHFIELQKQGKNALDHYLSFYLGKISEIDKQAEITIISKDTGFDVLIENLKHTHNHIDVTRIDDINLPTESCKEQAVVIDNNYEIYEIVVTLIQQLPERSLPRKKQALVNWVHNKSKKTTSLEIAEKIVNQMIVNKVIELDNLNVIYTFDR